MLKTKMLFVALLIFTIGPFAQDSSQAYAQLGGTCSYDMVDGRGFVIQKYYGYHHSQRWIACDEAKRQCESALTFQRRNNPGAYCRPSNSSDRPIPPAPAPKPPRDPFPPRYDEQCRAEMHRYDGRVLQTFYGTGRNMGDACRQARQRCERALSSGRDDRGNYCTTNPGRRR